MSRPPTAAAVGSSAQGAGATAIDSTLDEMAWVCGVVTDLAANTSTAKEDDPLVVGLPEMTPVDLWSLSPAGRAPDPGTSSQE